jgi:TolB-like protein
MQHPSLTSTAFVLSLSAFPLIGCSYGLKHIELSQTSSPAWTEVSAPKQQAPQNDPSLNELPANRSAPQIAILPLSPQGKGISESDAIIITDALSDALMRTRNFHVMERQQIDMILKEQSFESSGACDASECAVRVGRLLGIQQIVVGSIGKLGGSHILSLRRVDVKTGEILSSSTRNQRGAIEDLLQDGIPEAIEDLQKEQ